MLVERGLNVDHRGADAESPVEELFARRLVAGSDVLVAATVDPALARCSGMVESVVALLDARREPGERDVERALAELKLAGLLRWDGNGRRESR